MKKALSYDDVLLEPKYSDIESRSQVNIGNNLGDDLNSKIHFREPEIFEYKLRSQPNEINSGIATSLVFSAWNACTYVAQISDQMVKEKEADQSYIKCIEDIIRDHDGLWFYDEMLVADRK